MYYEQPYYINKAQTFVQVSMRSYGKEIKLNLKTTNRNSSVKTVAPSMIVIDKLSSFESKTDDQNTISNSIIELPRF